jgi:hypothetical protein
MSDILDRLRARVHPHFFTNAVAANLGACAVNPAVIHAQTGTVTIGGPDKDMQDAIAEIERLRACISDGAKWVFTEHRKPDDGKTVLGYWPGSGHCPASYESLTYHASDAPDSRECWSDVFGTDSDEPTYWMPLPEAPKC